MTIRPNDTHSNRPQSLPGYFVPIEERRAADDIDLKEIWRSLTRYKLMMLIIVIFWTSVAFALGLVIKPVYRAEVLMAPATFEGSQANFGGLAGQFGGLATLAGINIGPSDNVNEAIAILKSRGFTKEFINSQDLMPVLFSDRWDSEIESWIVDDSLDMPTFSEAYELFDEEVRSVKSSAETGLVTLNIDWTDRELAANWANTLVNDLNRYLRLRDIAEAKQSIEFLNSELDKTSVIGLQQGIFRLIEQQVEKIMLANVREEYAFRILDEAVPPDEDDFIWPRRAIMIVIGFFIGVCASLAATIIRNQLRHEY